MNLIVPINIQALRVSTIDAEKVTANDDYFAGPTTAFEKLPWRDKDFSEISNGKTKANVSQNIETPLWENAQEHLSAGIHLHWALPDALARGVQQAGGPVQFPPTPNRWLVTRVLTIDGGEVEPQTKQWVIESDYLMTEEEYSSTKGDPSYTMQTGRNCISVPVGWELVAGTDPSAGGAVYEPPSRRMGKVFELKDWPPKSADYDKMHLDELKLSDSHFYAAGKSPGPLTAVGYSGAAFAAYYPDCTSVFGFHDTFKDAPDFLDNKDNKAYQVSYQVTGWHSREEYDPLKRLGAVDNLSAQDLASKVQETYGWRYDGDKPERCLFAGQIVNIYWNASDLASTGKGFLTPDEEQEQDTSIRMVIGNSTSEAMAALIREEWKESSSQTISADVEQNLEFLLDALQSGLLHQLGTSQSLAQVEQTLHQQGFGALAGGKLWIIKKKQSQPDTAPQSPEVTLPHNNDNLAEKLHTLNAGQQRLDALLAVVESARRQIFLNWYQYIVYLNRDTPDSTFCNNLAAYLCTQIDDLWAKLEAAYGKKPDGQSSGNNIPVFYTGDIRYNPDQGYESDSPNDSLVGQIVSKANELFTLLKKDDYKQLFELQQTNAPRFWEPHEPVLLATGDSLKPARRNGVFKYLPCRVSGELIDKLEVTIGDTLSSAMGSALVDQIQLKAPQTSVTASMAVDIKTLLDEAALLDPSLAALLANKLGANQAQRTDLKDAITSRARRIGERWQEDIDEEDLSKRPELPRVSKSPKSQNGSVQITWSGTAPQGLALTCQGNGWKDPFLPLFLVWEADYRPFQRDGGNYAQNHLTQSFQLDENHIDPIPINPGQLQVNGDKTQLKGTIPLSSKAGQSLISQIEDFLTHNSGNKTDLQALIADIRKKPLLSQGLGGFNLTMLTRSASLQLTPFNPFYNNEYTPTPLGAGDDNEDYKNSLTHFVGGSVAAAQTDQSPSDAKHLSTIRTGYLEIIKLTVVDVFGRKKHIFKNGGAAQRVVPSWRLDPKTPNITPKYPVYFPPRLAQPARMLFRWLAAESDEWEMNAHPASTPICGWVLPNHLDNSLMLFTGSGQPLGSLGVFGGQEGQVTWQPVPGHVPRDIDTDLGQANPHLKRFADFVVNGQSREFFQALMDAIDNAHTYILPDDKQTAQAQAVLMGRPLALVRAGLRLELMGLPACDTGEDSLKQDTEHPPPYDWTQCNDADIRQVDFPVRLGDHHQAADGLVAFMLDSTQAIFAPAATTTGKSGVVQPAPDTLLLKLHARIDPPATAYKSAQEQIDDLRNYQAGSERTEVTLLLDPRAKIHAKMGILPIKAIELPPDQYAAALRSIQVTFFTHPVLREAGRLCLPLPAEAGYAWYWTAPGQPVKPDEPLQPNQTDDQARFSYSPQTAEDGWLKLKPQP